MPKGKPTKTVSAVMKDLRASRAHSGTKVASQTTNKKKTLASVINAIKPKSGKIKK